MSLAEHGWEVHPGALRAQVTALREAYDTLIGVHEPLRRQLTSRDERHQTDAWGRILNPVVVHHLPDLAPSLRTVLHAIVPLVQATLGPAALTQAAWVHSTRGTALHTDPHPFEAGARLIGAWVALEDIHGNAGPFVVVPGSRDLDPSEPVVAAWLHAAARAAHAQFHTDQDPTGTLGLDAAALLDELLSRRHLAPEPVLLAAGDVLLWDGALVHGSLRPGPGPQTRRSLLLHFIERRFAGG